MQGPRDVYGVSPKETDRCAMVIQRFVHAETTGWCGPWTAVKCQCALGELFGHGNQALYYTVTEGTYGQCSDLFCGSPLA